jgi:Zn finger protein HypA/HybF involved in hydrogenase expression
MVRCNHCGREYRADLLVACPRCRNSNTDSTEKQVQSEEGTVVERVTEKVSNGLVKCEECGRDYRADILERCPRCGSDNGYVLKKSGTYNKDERPLTVGSRVTRTPTHEQTSFMAPAQVQHRKSSFPAVALVIFMVGVVGFALSQFGILKIEFPNWSGVNQTGSVDIENENSDSVPAEPPADAGTDADFEMVDQAPVGHYETECRWVSTYNVQFDGTIEKIKERECVDKWVED